ncbi:hypothetical protein DFH08DRAFT_797967 [Mycena albidolilacea]|uniref:Uncharacterized protein n=1 Tax=Mycena albidolilacea TaxID=1033008 RepID=A0AAD7ASR7_9AGAR|nr:hypothetical protein DFH08DRAFT_797967 [Mycena albidolilacea]
MTGKVCHLARGTTPGHLGGQWLPNFQDTQATTVVTPLARWEQGTDDGSSWTKPLWRKGPGVLSGIPPHAGTSTSRGNVYEGAGGREGLGYAPSRYSRTLSMENRIAAPHTEKTEESREGWNLEQTSGSPIGMRWIQAIPVGALKGMSGNKRPSSWSYRSNQATPKPRQLSQKKIHSMCSCTTGQLGTLQEHWKTIYHKLKELLSMTNFVDAVFAGLAEVVKDTGHGRLCLPPEPINSDWPVHWIPLLDTPKRQPGTHQEVLGAEERSSNGWEGGQNLITPGRSLGDIGGKHHQPEIREPIDLKNGFRAQHSRAHHPAIAKHQHERCPIRALMKESARAAEVLHAIPEKEQGPVSVLVVPVEGMTGRGRGVEEEPKAHIPEKGEVAQSKGHAGGKEKVVCCRRTGTKGLRALIKFRTQSPCFKGKA